MACFLFYSVEVVRVVPQEQLADKIFEKRRISSVDIPLYLNMSFSVTFLSEAQKPHFLPNFVGGCNKIKGADKPITCICTCIISPLLYF